MKTLYCFLMIFTLCIIMPDYTESSIWPYMLEHTSDTEVVISWPTRNPVTPMIKYSTDENNLDMAAIGECVPFKDNDGNILHCTNTVTIQNLPPDKKWYFKMVSQSEGNPPFESETFIFSTDLTPPELDIISPADSAVLTGTVTLELTATDNVEVSKAGFNIKFDRHATERVEPVAGPDTLKKGVRNGYFYITHREFLDSGHKPLGDVFTFKSPPYRTQWDSTQFKDGVYEIEAWADGGPGVYKKIKVRIDNIPPDTTSPNVSITSPQDGDTVYGKKKIVISATDDDKIRWVRFFINGRKASYVHPAPYEGEWDTTQYDPGEYQLYAKAWDYSNNESESAPITVIVIETPPDTTPPVTTDDYENDGIWINQNANITLTATDDISGVAHTYYTIDNGPDQEGTTIAITEEGSHLVNYWSVDDLGNTEAGNTINVWIDKTPPVVTADITPEPNENSWNNTNVTVIFNAEDQPDLSGVASVDPPVVVSTESVGRQVTGTAQDNAGNEASVSVTVNLDKTAPVVTAGEDIKIEMATPEGTVVGITPTVTDNFDSAPEIVINAPKVFPLGTTEVTVTATDQAGNIASDTLEVTVYLKLPGVRICPPVIMHTKWTRGHVLVFIKNVGMDLTVYDIEPNSIVLGNPFNDTTISAKWSRVFPRKRWSKCFGRRKPWMLVVFSKHEVLNSLENNTGSIALTVSGDISTGMFEGDANVRVIKPRRPSWKRWGRHSRK